LKFHLNNKLQTEKGKVSKRDTLSLTLKGLTISASKM